MNTFSIATHRLKKASYLRLSWGVGRSAALILLSVFSLTIPITELSALQKGCIVVRGRSFSDSFTNLGVEESIEIEQSCSSISSRRSLSIVPGEVKSFRSTKSLSRPFASDCLELSDLGLTHTAEQLCDRRYESRWSAVCCPRPGN